MYTKYLMKSAELKCLTIALRDSLTILLIDVNIWNLKTWIFRSQLFVECHDCCNMPSRASVSLLIQPGSQSL